MAADFWQRCAEAAIVVVPFIAYSQWDNEAYSDRYRIGLRFVALQHGNADVVVRPGDMWLYVDEACADTSLVGETPEEALEKLLASLPPDEAGTP